MAFIDFNGTNSPDSLVYTKENDLVVDDFGIAYYSSLFDIVEINGFDGDDFISGVLSFSTYFINGGAGKARRITNTSGKRHYRLIEFL